jgi:hypothetical protein
LRFNQDLLIAWKQQMLVGINVHQCEKAWFVLCLQDAQAAGCVTISGLEMFVGQAADQFRMFTGQKPPVELMRQVVLDSLG